MLAPVQEKKKQQPRNYLTTSTAKTCADATFRYPGRARLECQCIHHVRGRERGYLPKFQI